MAMILTGLVGCGSAEKSYKIPDAESAAPGAAFTSDGMLFRKGMPHRPDPHPWEFYYKHCSKESDGFFTSKTAAYTCSDPF